MSAAVVEELLARLYTDEVLREKFLYDAERTIADLTLTDNERRAIVEMDRAGLAMAADSYAAKRRQRCSARVSSWRTIITRLWPKR